MTYSVKNINLHFSGFILVISLLLFSSCVNSKKMRYFTSIQNDSTTIIKLKPRMSIIQPSDILQISFYSPDESTNKILNSVGGAASSSGSAAAGYLVDDSGNIKLPMLGKVRCSGMLKEALADSIALLLVNGKFAKDPIVTVRISNFRITVLGEVGRPGVLYVPNERITITEAISLAGDLTIFGKRDNVLIIREKDGKRLYKRLNLNTNDLFDSEYYYLDNMDIIYVEPTNKKAAPLDRSTQFFSLGMSTLSIFVLLYTQLIAK